MDVNQPVLLKAPAGLANAPRAMTSKSKHRVASPAHVLISQRVRIITSCIVLGVLAAAHVVLVYLWGSKILDKHLFSIDKVSMASQAISLAAPAFITISLVLLTVLVQGFAADQIIRRREPSHLTITFAVLVLNDSLFAPQGNRSQPSKTISNHGKA